MFLPTMTTEERVDALEALKAALSGPVHDYFAMVNDSIEVPADIYNLDAPLLASVLSSVERAVSSHPPLCRLAEMDDEARRFAFGRVRRAVGLLLGKASVDVLDRFKPLWKVDRTSPPDLAKFVAETVQWLSFLLGTKVLTTVFSFLSSNAGNFVDAFPDGRIEFLEIVRVELRLFWLDLLQGMAHYSSPLYFKDDGPRHPSVRHTEMPPPTVTLAMCRFAADLPVRSSYEAFASKLWGRKKEAQQPDAWSKVRRVVADGSAGDEVMLDAKDVVDSVGLKSQELAATYVANVAETLSMPMDDYLGWKSDWISSRAPVERVSEAVSTLLEEVGRCEKEVLELFPDPEGAKGNAGPPTPSALSATRSATSFATPFGLGSRGPSSPNLGLSATAGGGARNLRADRNLMVNIDKLFADKEEWIARAIKPGRATMLGGITKLVLKGWLELVRAQTFGKDGFQQLQADVEISRVALWRYASDHR
jgi:hypothetical protein